MAIALGIDYGAAKVGIAVSSGSLAAPLRVIRYSGFDKLALEIKKIAGDERAELVVVGVSEGESADRAYEFGNKLSKELGIPVEFIDETLSTQEVQAKTIEAGMKRIKRKSMEDAFAAALILQDYLDSK